MTVFRFCPDHILPESEENKMVISPGDRLRLKKSHPCGCDRCEVLRSGMDFRLRCLGCGHMWEMPRGKLERAIKEVETNPAGEN